jgi:hypothetical protein
LSAGDILVAVDGLRVTATNLDNLLSRYAVGESIQVMAFRRDELMSFDLVLQGDRVPGVTLTLESAETIRTAASKRKLIKAASLRCGFFYPASFYASQFWQKLKCGAYCDLLDPTTVIFMATLMACAMSVVLYSAHLSFPKRFKACANGPGWYCW